MDRKREKPSFEQDTLSSNVRNLNCATSVDSLDLHLSATYDHQYDLFVNKTEVVSQLQRTKPFRKNEQQPIGTDSISIIFGKILANFSTRFSHLFEPVNFRWDNKERIAL